MTAGFVVRSTWSTGPDTHAIDGPMVVGRTGDLAIADPTVSREHARIEPFGDRLRVTDLGSTAGVLLNGSPITSAEVDAGDVLRLGDATLRVLRLVRSGDRVDGPRLRVIDGTSERVVPIGDELTIGRDPAADLTIDDPTVSRRHAVVRRTGDGIAIEDLGSGNGTRVDGRRIAASVTVTDGTRIEVGASPAELRVVLADDPTGPVDVRVGVEGRDGVALVRVDATPDATVAEVTAELAAVVGAPDDELLVYRPEDGVLLHPDDHWVATGPLPGDELVIGIGDASALPCGRATTSPRPARIRLNQLPRTIRPEPSFRVAGIEPPESASVRGRGMLWQIAGGLGAVVIGLTLAFVNPDYAIFGLITGGIGITSIAASILGDQSRRRHRVREYRDRLRRLDGELAEARSRQAASLRALSPSVDEMERWLAIASPRIWERRPDDPDALRPALGTGRRPTRLDIEPTRRDDSPLAAELHEVLARHAELVGVPVTGPGPGTGTLGVCGSPDQVRDLLARMVVEAAVLHPPDQLRIRLAGADPTWRWCRWLPHVEHGERGEPPPSDTSSVGSVAAIARELAADGSGTDRVLQLVVVPDATRCPDLGALQRAIVGRGLLVVGAVDRRDLPGGMGAVVDIARDSTAALVGDVTDPPVGSFTVEGLDPGRAERLAIALGRLGGPRRSTSGEGLVELLGLGDAAMVDVVASWADEPHDRLTVPIGVADDGSPVTVGFRRDGPHGMIAGTTGSGKSELLQTILTALALRHSPDRFNLFLVDFKGGSTFAPLAPLPHVVGLVTDLEQDASLATRALTALDAEIDRRKRVLDDARVPDITAYHRSAVDDRPPLPDLLVVIDEFALLVARQPEVRDRLDTIATQGRSLGIHLLLATQSPTGVVTHAIRTNTNLWICLRVVTDSESMEILGARDAARIPDGSPGRGIIRLGAGDDLRPFQAARVARPLPTARPRVAVTPLDGRRSPARTSERAVEHPTATELDAVVRRIAVASDELGLPAPTPLWLPPLPAVLPAGQVVAGDRPSDRLAVVVGLADLPRRHRQEPFVVDLSSAGHLLVAGAFGSGKTTTLTGIAADLGRAYSPADVHLYGIDAGAGALSGITGLPHLGDVVGASDGERLRRLVERLDREVDGRRDRLAAAGVGGFLEWRRTSAEVPWIVLLVDDYPALREAAEGIDSGRLLERFNALLQHGPAVGVHLVVAVTQAVDLRTRELNLIPARVVLRSADAADFALVGARFGPDDVPRLVPGRGLTDGATEVQVGLPDADSVARVAAQWRHITPERRARPVGRLPRSVDFEQLPRLEGRGPIGVGGAEIEPVPLPTDGASTVLLVAGPRQSGRSTTLLTALRSADPRSVVLIVAPRPSPLRALTGSRVRAITALDELDVALDEFAASAGPGSALVIDDAETLAGARVGERLEHLLRTASETGIVIVVAARVNDLSGMFDPWARYLTSLRRVVLLQPTLDDVVLFGAKLPPIPPPLVPGRGLLIDGADVTVVQIATTESS